MVTVLPRTVLPRTVLPSTESAIRSALAGGAVDGATHYFWLFTGASRRRVIERELAAEGWRVRLHSAFKPLVSELLERRSGWEPLPTPTAITIDYPAHQAAVPNRFRLEAYPLERLARLWWPGAVLTLTPKPVAELEHLCYSVRMERPGAVEAFDVFAPNRVVDVPGRVALTPCGWWRVIAQDGTVIRDEPWETDYERLYRLVLDSVSAQPWSGPGPYFDQLRIEVEHDGIEERLPVGHDRLDTAEALHEELYFSLLERFALMCGLPEGSRQLQPGQVVPMIRNVNGGETAVSVVALTASGGYEGVGDGPSPSATRVLSPAELAGSDTALAEPDVTATLLAFPGERLAEHTPRGRVVHGIWRRGARPAVVINGGQHANETSGVVGALRAAYELLADPDTSLGVVALENPDGYALHRELCAVHAEHMHHAARYSALGDDLEYRGDEAPFESAVRRRLLALGGAQLLINLHGYPAHEWVRPLTGYLPHKFEWWAVPQGFILIARYQPDFAERAESLLRTVARAVQTALPELVAFNDAQLAAYEAHAGKLLFPLEGSVPLVLTETARPGPAVQLITEYPDETVHGAAFRLAHEVQYRVAVGAARAWPAALAGLPPLDSR